MTKRNKTYTGYKGFTKSAYDQTQIWYYGHSIRKATTKAILKKAEKKSERAATTRDTTKAAREAA